MASHESRGKKTRILIVDDQAIFAEGLKYAIESRTADFEVLGIAANGREALDKIAITPPDIVLMDVRMPVMDGVKATEAIKKSYPAIKILILTTFEDDEYVQQSMAHGAAGYLIKDRSPDEVVVALRAVARGIIQVDPAISEKLFRSARAHGEEEEIARGLRSLTGRERQILRLLVDARQISQIARDLRIADQTVRNHIANIYSKLGIHNQIEIIRYVNQIRSFLDGQPADLALPDA
jgi:DNA-binding NarL/FixJ family response regulator